MTTQTESMVNPVELLCKLARHHSYQAQRIEVLESYIKRLALENERLKFNPQLHMLNRHGTIDAMSRIRGQVGVGFADGDSFKTLNNVHPELGYAFADRLVSGFAQAFRQEARTVDGFADHVLLGQRQDGDEYIVIVPAGDIVGAMKRLQELMHAQPLTPYERARLLDLSHGTMSYFTATMAFADNVSCQDVLSTVDRLAATVLKLKAHGRRDCIVNLTEVA